MNLLPIALALSLVGLAPTASAQAVKDREGAVRNDRAVMEKDTRWIYNDWKGAFEKARWSGKPVLAVLRCVPCLACSGIDAQVLLQDSELAPLLDKFICVRIINANALDLALFQFDYDLSFSTLFFNGDGTLYGRYGSWTHQKNPQEKATAGYRKAVEAALALHRNYPANKESLAGKQAGPGPYRSTLEIPELGAKYKPELDWQGKVVPSCVHCHQIGDALRTQLRQQGKPLTEELIYPHPAPETVGLSLALDQVATVEAVMPKSAAAQAGFQAGDEILSLAGQPLISSADFSWALHRTGSPARPVAVVKRAGQESQLTLSLPANWRQSTDISRRVGTWQMRAMESGGLLLEDLPDEERRKNGLGLDSLALVVKHAGEYGQHAVAKKAGFRKGDIVVRLEGLSGRLTESEVIGAILRKHPPGTKLKSSVIRAGQALDLLLPVQ